MTYKKIGVVGSGFMGTEIAYVIASSLEAEVVVQDISQTSLDKAKGYIEKLTSKAVEKGRMTPEARVAVLSRLAFKTDLEALRGADLVVEAVFENVEVKRGIFQKLEELCSEEAILASNTSGLPITHIAHGLKHPERVIGTHFFSPASVMKLVEIVTGYKTAPEVVEKTKEFCARIGKESMVCKDHPGFVTTRVAFAAMAEAMRCLEEGVAAVEDIDKAMRLGFNWAMGPLEMADFVGLDVSYEISNHFEKDLGDRFRTPTFFKRMVEAGNAGRKSGRGFYDYTKK